MCFWHPRSKGRDTKMRPAGDLPSKLRDARFSKVLRAAGRLSDGCIESADVRGRITPCADKVARCLPSAQNALRLLNHVYVSPHRRSAHHMLRSSEFQHDPLQDNCRLTIMNNSCELMHNSCELMYSSCEIPT